MDNTTSTGAGLTEWPRERLDQVAGEICDPATLRSELEAGQAATPETVREVIRKAGAAHGLTPQEAAVLVQVGDAGLRGEIMAAARRVHEQTFQRRISIQTPVCPSNRCVNECLYCPLRRSNAKLHRTSSTTREMQREMLALLDEGYRHVELVFGEDRSGVHYVRDMIWAASGTRSGLRRIQRVDVNLNPLRMDELTALREALYLGTYHIFQETYDPQVYAGLHPSGPKADYAWRLTCHDRAFEAGLADVGLGVLLGAGDYRFDVVAVLRHAEHLEQSFGRGPCAITYPRMLPSPGAAASYDRSNCVSDADFEFVVAVTRLALPCADIVLCTPASSEIRRELYALGVSQVSVGSLSYPGVYTNDGDPGAARALTIGRPRELEDLVYRLCEWGFVPNFCVVCYEMKSPTCHAGVARPCVDDRCGPNALLALKEYLIDHAAPETQTMGERLIQHELARLPEELRQSTLEIMEEVEAGLRRQVL